MPRLPSHSLHHIRCLVTQTQGIMAAKGAAQMSVGSKSWIRDENVQVVQFCAQETEDFTFSARNEVEWLNEHMADIFSKSQVNFTEIFKTPGKLRGKTPRTAKKRNPLETREVSAWCLKGAQILTACIAFDRRIQGKRSAEQYPYT